MVLGTRYGLLFRKNHAIEVWLSQCESFESLHTLNGNGLAVGRTWIAIIFRTYLWGQVLPMCPLRIVNKEPFHPVEARAVTAYFLGRSPAHGASRGARTALNIAPA